MHKKYSLFTWIIIISLSIVSHAADDTVQLPKQLMICAAGLKEPNDNLHILITLSDNDSFSGVTFENLFKTNALKHRIPWVIHTVLRKEAPIIIFNRTSPSEARAMLPPVKYTTECHDALTLLNAQMIDISPETFASHARIKAIMSKLLKEKLQENSYYCQTNSTCVTLTSGTGLVYYDTDGNTTSISPYNALGTAINNHDPALSDLSCTLAIAQRGDYRQLIPILYALQHPVDDVNKGDFQYRYDFWLKTFKSLPLATQQTLVADAQKRFGITLDLSTQ